jgi:hypothetical protein
LRIDKNTLKFEEKWGLAGIKLAQYSSTKHIFKSEWKFGVWWELSPLIPTKTLVLPPCRIIGQVYILRQTLTINFSQKYKIFDIKIIPLESYFEYKSNGIIFI